MEWDKLLFPKRVRALMGGLDESREEHRREFQRDYDRVVFSSPVRRLQDKAQVFPLEPIDAVRTRLTHSLEVSTLSRGIVLKVAELLGDSHPFSSRSNDIQTIAVTAGLLHDLGNPPFGHFGEAAIQEWFRVNKAALQPLAKQPWLLADFEHYEGNARTIRLICNLQVLADRSGLNLTAATLSASMKYVASSQEAKEGKGGHTKSKPGYFFAERSIVESVWKETGTGGNRNPIAFLVEAADDAVYSLCDLEDAVKKGILTWQELVQRLKLLARKLSPEADSVIESLIDSTLQNIASRSEGSDGLEIDGRSRDDANMQMFRILGHTKLVQGAAKAFVTNYKAIMDGEYDSELLNDPASNDARHLRQICKEIGRTWVYCTRQNIELELRGRTVIQDLMDLIWRGIERYDGSSPKPASLEGKCWSLLSETYKAVFIDDWKRIPAESHRTQIPIPTLQQYYRLLLLADYIAGMTDGFACKLHASLTNARE